MAPAQLRKKAQEIVDMVADVDTSAARAIKEAWKLNNWKNVIKLGDPTWYKNFVSDSEPVKEPVKEPEPGAGSPSPSPEPEPKQGFKFK